MKTVRQYPKGCDLCNATGFVSETGLSSSATRTCPVCHGSGVIIVTETIEDDWLEQLGQIIPKSII